MPSSQGEFATCLTMSINRGELRALEHIETGAEISGSAMVKGLAAIQAALEAEGIEFTDDKGVPGVRLHPKGK
jgi:hypothetical protein